MGVNSSELYSNWQALQDKNRSKAMALMETLRKKNIRQGVVAIMLGAVFYTFALRAVLRWGMGGKGVPCGARTAPKHLTW